MDVPAHGIVEVNYNAGQELRKGIQEYRNKFCDVRLWVENHAIPAHKMILSLHSTFFQQMFAAESESASEVYLNDIRYNVLYPIIEFMYTGRAHIESTEVFEEIKALSRSINFVPFSTLWNDGVQPMLSMASVVAPTPDNNNCLSATPSNSSAAQRMSPIPNMASTQVTSCFPMAQMSPAFAPRLVSTPIPTNRMEAPCNSYERFAPLTMRTPTYAPSTPLRINSSPRSPTNLYVVPPTPPSILHSLLQRPPAPMERSFLGFSSRDITSHLLSDISSRLFTTQESNCCDIPIDSVVNPQTKTSVDSNPTHSIIELSDISQASPRPDPHDVNVIEIEETDVEIVENDPSPAQIVVPSDNVTSSIAVDTVNNAKEMDSKPQVRRGRPKKDKLVEDDKIRVSTKSLFKKTRQSQRGTKKNISNHY